MDAEKKLSEMGLASGDLQKLQDLVQQLSSQIVEKTRNSGDATQQNDWTLFDTIINAFECTFGHLSRLETDKNTENALKKTLEQLIESVGSLKAHITVQMSESSSNDELEKLRKKLSKIEDDLEEKDKALLDQETKLLQLTDELSEAKKDEEKMT